MAWTQAAAWTTRRSDDEQRRINADREEHIVEVASGNATIETFAAVYKRGQPSGGMVIARLASGGRCLAVTPGDAQNGSERLFSDKVIGESVVVAHADNVNTFTFA